MKNYEAQIVTMVGAQRWKTQTFVWRAKNLGTASDRAGNQVLLMDADLVSLQEQVAQPVAIQISVREADNDYKSNMARKLAVSVESLDQEQEEAEDEGQDPREAALWEAHDKEGRRVFGKKRWEGANFGWGTTEDSIASKVYGKDPKVLVSGYQGDTIKHTVEDY
jgi:hypothetical protein